MIKLIKSINIMIISSTFFIVCVLLQNLYNILNNFIYDMTQQVTPDKINYIDEFILIIVLIIFFLSVLIKSIYETWLNHERTN